MLNRALRNQHYLHVTFEYFINTNWIITFLFMISSKLSSAYKYLSCCQVTIVTVTEVIISHPITISLQFVQYCNAHNYWFVIPCVRKSDIGPYYHSPVQNWQCSNITISHPAFSSARAAYGSNNITWAEDKMGDKWYSSRYSILLSQMKPFKSMQKHALYDYWTLQYFNV